METPLAHRDRVERYHAREHAAVAKTLAQDRNIADAVLQGDDDRILRRVLRDLVRDIGGVGALHRDQHDAGAVEDRRILRQRELAGPELLLGAVEIGQKQAEPLDLGLHPGPHQQRDAAPLGCQHAADETADGACAGHHDRSIRNHQTSLP